MPLSAPKKTHILQSMQAYTMELPLIFASADAPRTATLEYDNGCHGLKLTLRSLLSDGAWKETTYVNVPKYVPYSEKSLHKTLADYFVWRATQTCPEQVSATANQDLAQYYSHYKGFEFAINKVEAYAPNEWEGYECLKPSALFELVRVTFAYEYRTQNATHTNTEVLNFSRLL